MADLTEAQKASLFLSPEKLAATLDIGGGRHAIMTACVEVAIVDGDEVMRLGRPAVDIVARLKTPMTPERLAAIQAWGDQLRQLWPGLTDDQIMRRCTGACMDLAEGVDE
jgi:hypothetical protein